MARHITLRIGIHTNCKYTSIDFEYEVHTCIVYVNKMERRKNKNVLLKYVPAEGCRPAEGCLPDGVR